MKHVLTSLASTAYRLGLGLNQAGRRARRRRFEVPIVSVGGVTAGGSGKTPLVRHLLEEAEELGFQPVVLTRGYGRRTREDRVWRPGSSPGLADPAIFGDEPAMLSRQVPGSILLVGKHRSRVLRAFLDSGTSEGMKPLLVILDDGFQHRQISRDLDIVILPDVAVEDPTLLPFGLLREPLEALRRANVICTTGPNGLEYARRLTTNQPTTNTGGPPIRPLVERTEFRSDPEGKVLLVSGIACPERFRNSLDAFGLEIGEHMIFNDHHDFSDADVAVILRAMKSHSATSIVTTEKDYVKLDRYESLSPYLHPLLYELRPTCKILEKWAIGY